MLVNFGKDDTEMKSALFLFFTILGAAPAQANRDPAVPGAPTFPPLPQPACSFGAAVTGDWLYVYGGHVARTHTYSTDAVVGSFRRLKLSDPTRWEDLPSGPAAQGLALVAHQGKLYRIGGMQPRNAPGEKADNHSLASSACFDPQTGKWQPLPDLPQGRSSHDAVVVGEKIFVLGGWRMNGAGKPSTWHRTALVLDLKRQPLKWEAIAQPFQRRALVAAVHGGKVYVLGGIADDGAVEQTVNLFDPATNTWTTGPDLPGPRRNGFSPACCVAGSRLYVNPGDGKLYRLTEKGDAWEAVGQLQQPRIVHRLVAVGERQLLALGGASKGENVALTEVIELSRLNAGKTDTSSGGGR
jgi:N-acetylneuraminic acid mutarotase